jgi:hypothetical protein
MLKNALKTSAIAFLFCMSFTQGFGQDSNCEESLPEPWGSTTTVCDNGDGTSTFIVASTKTNTPGACRGIPNNCVYSYIA